MSATRTESVMHDKIHAGEAFDVSTTFAAVAAAASRNFIVGNGSKQLHSLFIAASGAGADLTLELYESPTITSNGTALTPVNRRLASIKTSGASFYHTGTVSDNGTLKTIRVVPFGQPISPSVADRLEWILSPNTNYLVIVKNVATSGNAIIGLGISFYIVG